jgi:uncharacterized protein
MYIKRIIEKEVKTLAKEFPIVAILGPRQSGKTTLVKHIFKKYKYISLEDPDIRKIASSDPRGFLERYSHNVIIDEVQRIPELFSYIQTASDKSNKPGSFILTGSQNYLLSEKISQSLAGRVGISTLLPFSVEEILSENKKHSLDNTEITGFYPRIFEQNIRPSSFYSSYVATYLEKDIRMIKNITNYDSFHKFLKIMAGRSGQVLNTLAISNECDVSHNTINEWTNLLERSYIIFRIHPYHKNFNKRIIKKAKVYFYDVGLLSYLLGIKNKEHLNSHYLKGAIFETLVMSEFMKNNFNRALNLKFYFWRNKSNKEVDLIVEDGVKVKSIEIKSGKTIRDDFFGNLKYWNQLAKNNNSFVIYAGENEFKTEGVEIVNWKNISKI